AGPGTADDVGAAIAIEITGRHAHAAAEGGAEGEEVAEELSRGSAEDAHLRQAARVGATDDVGPAIAVDVAGGHVRAAREQRREREEVAEHREGLAVEDAHLRRRAGARGAKDVGHTVAADVADGHANTASEARGEGEEATLDQAGGGIIDVDLRRATGV